MSTASLQGPLPQPTAESPMVPIDFSAIERIAVFRALQLGDLLCTVPALRALRAAAPQAKITLIGLPWAETFATRYRQYLDDFLAFPGFPGLPETPPRLDLLPAFFASAQARRFDLALQWHGSGLLSNPLSVALGAQRNVGFYVPGNYCPEPQNFFAWSEQEHEVLRFTRLLNGLGVPVHDSALEFPLQTADYASLQAALAALPQTTPPLQRGRYICVHPGARLPSRRWLPERFAKVADSLAQSGWQIVLTGSPDERAIVDAVVHAMQSRPIDLCGRTDLGGLAALIADAGLVVCNDTGISHVAAAVATPSVVVCSGADPGRWAPLDQQRHRLIHAEVDCRPCGHAVCPIGHPCARKVSVESVLREASLLLNAPQSQAPSETPVLLRDLAAGVRVLAENRTLASSPSGNAAPTLNMRDAP